MPSGLASAIFVGLSVHVSRSAKPTFREDDFFALTFSHGSLAVLTKTGHASCPVRQNNGHKQRKWHSSMLRSGQLCINHTTSQYKRLHRGLHSSISLLLDLRSSITSHKLRGNEPKRLRCARDRPNGRTNVERRGQKSFQRVWGGRTITTRR